MAELRCEQAVILVRHRKNHTRADPLHYHTLRHTAITHLVQAGVDLPTVKRISGHKTLKMVKQYSHQNGTHIQTAMDKLDQCYRTNRTNL